MCVGVCFGCVLCCVVVLLGGGVVFVVLIFDWIWCCFEVGVVGCVYVVFVGFFGFVESFVGELEEVVGLCWFEYCCEFDVD